MVHQAAGRPRVALRAARAAMALAMLMGPIPCAQGQDADAAARGCDLYMQVRFDDAIAVLEGALARQELQGDRLLQARICLARAYFKKGDAPRSRETFKSVLRMDPTWRPDPIEIPPDEILVFESALAEFDAGKAVVPPIPAPEPATPPAAVEQPKATPPVSAPSPALRPQPTVPPPASLREEGGGSVLKKWWFWGLALGAGTAVAVLAGGGDDGGGGSTEPDPLPGFPSPPPTP